MKIFLIFFLLTISNLIFAQDSILLETRLYSGKVFRVMKGIDTTYVGYYNNGKLESKREIKNNRPSGHYERWYKNGGKMWKKNMINDLENGSCIYFNKKGEKVAEFIFKNGVITDTVFVSTKESLLFGKATRFEIVHGGVEREENDIKIESKPEELFWPYVNYPFTIVKIIDSKTVPIVIETFETDFYGLFFICLEEGEYGFFPPNTDLKKLIPGGFCPMYSFSDSGHMGWNMQSPLKVSNTKPVFFHLHFSSESWAP